MVAIIAALLDIGFAIFHLLFWRLFVWPESLKAAGVVNRAVTQTLNWVLIYVFIAYGGSVLWFALGQGRVPPPLLASGAGFWLLRTSCSRCCFQCETGRRLSSR